MNAARKKPSAKRFTVTDLFIITTGTVLVGSLSAWQWQPEQVAAFALVNNHTSETIQLGMHGNHVHRIAGKLGNSELEINAGKIRFRNSPCRQRVCIHTGWLKESGEAAACLPNGISVVLHSDSPRYDSINF